MRNKGFTLIEMVVAMTVSLFMMLIVGVLLLSAFNGWDRNDVILKRQREASIANKYMANAIRMAVIDNVTEPGVEGDTSDQLRVGDKAFYFDGDSLYYAISDAQDDRAIIENNVESFNVEKTSRGVIISVTLINGGEAQDVEWVLACRN